MKSANIIVGAGYGDEGKGLVTSYFAQDANLVVRFNGGAQAAHTVEMPSRSRHVFGHIGSGYFSGVPTYLSKYFIVNPLTFQKEHKELLSDTRTIPRGVYINSEAMITTPFDMIINQELERIRNQDKHGSCGLGINETVTRSIDHPLNYVDVITMRSAELRGYLRAMLKHYYRDRVKKLTQSMYSGAYDNIMGVLTTRADSAIEQYIEAILYLTDHTTAVTNVNEAVFLSGYDKVVFEGAQGIMLDEYYGEFPHVTRSRTTSYNAWQIIRSCGLPASKVQIYYVTRAYATRHGHGSLKYEHNVQKYQDKTNIHNEFQGSLRTADLDMRILLGAIRHDATLNHLHVNKCGVNIVMTCVDQIRKSSTDNIPVHTGDSAVHSLTLAQLAYYHFEDLTGYNKMYITRSPVTPKFGALIHVEGNYQ